MPVLGQFPTRIHLIDTVTVKWTAGAAYADPNDPNYAVRDTTANVAIGGVDARTTTAETVSTSDYTKLVTFSNAAAIAVALDSSVASDFFCAAACIGAGTATLTPSSGQIRFNGALAASLALATGQTAILFFDGTNWDAAVITNGTLSVAQGGTGDSTLTAHAILVGEGTAPIAGVGPGTLNYPLLGQGASADPAFEQPRGNTSVFQCADSTTNPTSGDLASFDANGNVNDSGVLASAVATKAGIQDESYTYASDTGAANAYAVALSPALAAYAAGVGVVFKAANANTGASTLNVNSLGAVTIKKWSSGSLVNLASGDISAGQIITVVYDGTYFQMLGGSGGGATPVPVENEIVTFSGTSGTLANTPSSVAGYTQVKLHRGSGRMAPGAGNDFTWSGANITLAVAAGGEVFLADYWK